MRHRILRRAGAGLAALSLLAACAVGPGSANTQEGHVAVATTTMLGSIVDDIVACGGGTSATLMQPGADPHDVSLSSEQVATVVGADLVVANGLGLEEDMAQVLQNAQADGATVLEVGPLLDPIPFRPGELASTQTQEQTQDRTGRLDPHVWLDIGRMARAAELIGNELVRVTGTQHYEACGLQVRDNILAAEQTARARLDQVPAAQRVLVTDHYAFGYFAQAYGYRMAGVVVPGGSTNAQPSSADVSSLVSTIRATEVPAIFSNTALSSDLVQTVAREAGGEVAVVPLYVGSVGPAGSEAATYETMMTTNAERIATALAGAGG